MGRLGQIALRYYYTPLHRLRDCLREGGPFEQRRTERGRQEMERAARDLPPLPMPAGAHPPLDLHLLTGKRFWYQTLFCLWTFSAHSRRTLRPIIYDDGTLTPEFRDPLARHFPAARFVSQAETLARLEVDLPATKYPTLRERWINYPNIRKLTDVHVGSTGWKLVLDSDLLFFRPPQLLVDWLAQPTEPLHAVDYETSYGYTRALMNQLAGAAVADLVNVGLTGLSSDEIDWDRLEFWCARLITREGTSYYLEQALIAMLVAKRTCVIAPKNDYVTLPVGAEARNCQAVMHHYVAHSKRDYFQRNWRHAVALGSTVSSS